MSNVFARLLADLKAKVSDSSPTPVTFGAVPKAPPNRPIRTAYHSVDVPIPEGFLVTSPPDARPIIVNPIDFRKTVLPEYHGRYAVVLDHVLSPSECAELLRLAEASVPPPPPPDTAAANGPDVAIVPRNSEHDPWGPALVNIGGGYEVLDPQYRRSDRIIWDQREVVARLWARMMSVPDDGEDGPATTMKRRLAEVGSQETNVVHRVRGERPADRWVFDRVNERMRFLKYGKGGFFKPHCDAVYADTTDPSKTLHTIFTIHLYLNDSKAEVPDAQLVGGATTFFSFDEARKIDIHPKAGRVLIFQHRNILHSGDPVLKGIKYSVRTDILYEYRDMLDKSKREKEDDDDDEDE
ncbi:hypothetical protein VTJ83DRAFT_3957 [Remersonia thermophila]|uniref:Prolyl 4-hydroxylase alpha subunit domain-containing protein n=1 Tax=Remersonia thermophila TaxID=72144 RepID=A0ABR4DFK2_9PEZI